MGNDAELLVERDLVVVVDRHTIDADASRSRVVEPGDELDHGRLARAGLADERDRLTGSDVDVDAA